jgi:3-oxoadipate enol-lactonase
MPNTNVNETRVHYELSGPTNAPLLVFSNSLGSDLSMWDTQMPEVQTKYRVLRYDTRGHGQTSVTPGPYTIEQLGRDVLGLLDALSLDEFAFCGLSMGGMVGMWLGAHAYHRVQKLVLCSTAAKIGNEETWDARIAAVRKGGMNSISQAVMERWFTARFRSSQPDAVARTKRMIEATDVEGYVGCCGALRSGDLRESVGSIRTRTLVISGTHDPATTPADGRFLAERISGARYVELDAAHLSNIEQGPSFTRELTNFLAN